MKKRNDIWRGRDSQKGRMVKWREGDRREGEGCKKATGIYKGREWRKGREGQE